MADLSAYNKKVISQQKASGKNVGDTPVLSQVGGVVGKYAGQALATAYNNMNPASQSDVALWNEAMAAANPQESIGQRVVGAATNEAEPITRNIQQNVQRYEDGSVQSAQEPTTPDYASMEYNNTGTEQKAYTLGNDEIGLFNALKSGELQASPTLPEWNSMYEGGKATDAQKRAWARWMKWSEYSNMDGQQLLNQMRMGKLSPNSPVWNDLSMNGQMTPAQQYAYAEYSGEREIDAINEQMQFTNQVIEKAHIQAEDYTAAQANSMSIIRDLESKIQDIMMTPPTSAAEKYKEAILENPELNALSDQAADLEGEIKKIDVETLYLEDEIRDLVQGEAHQGYIDALASEKASDLYKKKSMLLIELDTVTSKLQYEMDVQQEMMKYELQDEQTQYGRMIDLLNFGLDTAKFEHQMARDGIQDQLAIANYNLNVDQFNVSQAQNLFSNQLQVANYKMNLRQQNTAEAQQMLQNEMQIQEFLHTVPKGQVVTLSTGVYVGMGSDANISVIEHIEPDGSTWVLGMDKNTGEKLYKQYIGQTAGEEGGGALSDPLNTAVYQQTYQDIQDVQSGKLTQVGDKVYDAKEYAAYEAAENYNDIFKTQLEDYRTDYKAWLEMTSSGKETNYEYIKAGNYDKVRWDTAPKPPELPEELEGYYTLIDSSESPVAMTGYKQITPISKPVGRTYKFPMAKTS